MTDLNDYIVNSFCLVYVLRCEEGKYYVGSSDHLNNRLCQHYHNEGSLWTKKYKPQKICGIRIGNRNMETKVVIQMMAKHGIENVRGGGYCKIDLPITDDLREKVRKAKNKALNDY
tara:strand:+ start:1088 stop:1435 length:348 start_codon:yes stop_codon:yes gene_type:complete